MGDRMVDTWLHHGEASREESRRRFEEFKSNTRRRGEDLSRRVSDSLRSSMPVATRDQVASLERQVAELKQQIETMKSAGAAPPSSGRDRPTS
jgi:polyhydroxyalkanoate synthesis regulator phasin